MKNKNNLPRLWVPTLTFYRETGEIDFERTDVMLARIYPYCQGVLVPGSTGDGWLLDDKEQYELVKHYLSGFEFGRFKILIGALMPDAESTLAAIEKWCGLIKFVSDCSDIRQGMDKLNVVGFVVCSPKGNHSQEYIQSSLHKVFSCGLPLAFYQLPQITGNLVEPETLRIIAAQFPNLIMVKDTGGGDEIAKSGLFKDKMLVRGAEGNPGPLISGKNQIYDGLLLSTVNSFPAVYAEIIVDGKGYDKIGDIISKTFAMASVNPVSNAFSDANRAIDHVMYYGDNSF